MIAVAGKKRPTRIRDSPNAIIPSTGPAISRCASRNTLILATTSTRTLSKHVLERPIIAHFTRRQSQANKYLPTHRGGLLPGHLFVGGQRIDLYQSIQLLINGEGCTFSQSQNSASLNITQG